MIDSYLPEGWTPSEPPDDGVYAFPLSASEGYHPGHPGMSLRDYFAAQALAFLSPLVKPEGKSMQEWAATSYQIADTMLAERSQQRIGEDRMAQLASVPRLIGIAKRLVARAEDVTEGWWCRSCTANVEATFEELCEQCGSSLTVVDQDDLILEARVVLAMTRGEA